MSIDVEIVRPKRTGAEVVGNLVEKVVNLFVSSWAVMLLAPIAFNQDPGFWRSLAAVCAVRMLINADGQAYTFWTKEAVR
jgi:hypothetical protein